MRTTVGGWWLAVGGGTQALAVAAALALAGPPLAAQAIPFSQHGSVSQRVGFTDVTVEYNRPVAHGRKLFGDHGVVPWNEIWHPGADSATTITFSRPVLVDGHPLAAGAYTLWTIPRPDRWTLIFSRAVHVFHIPYPGAAQDALRCDVTPETGAPMETLAFYFPVVGPDSAVLRLHWGSTVVPLTIRTAR
jgi:Protein of unknown function (DUF2911)